LSPVAAASSCEGLPGARERHALALLALAIAVGCGDGGPAEPTGPVPSSISVTPSAVTLASLGETVQLTVRVLDATGQVIAGVGVTWATTDASVATVDANGLVTAVWNGNTRITAAVHDGITGSATVVVAQQPSELRVRPAVDTLRAVEDTVRLSAQAFDANGNAVEDAEITWSSSDVSIVKVDTAGLAEALGNGSAEITAVSGPAWTRAALTVVQEAAQIELSGVTDTLHAVGDTLRLSALAVDANGNVAVDAAFEWSSSDESVVTVDDDGLVTALAAGTANVRAASGTASARLAVTVAQQVAMVRMSTSADTLWAVGDTTRLQAEAVDRNGHAVEGATLVWWSSDESVAAVDDSGLVTAVWYGSARIMAAAGGSTGRANIAVVIELGTPRDGLVALYRVTDGPNWRNKENWLTDKPIGSWYGVDTDAQGRVTELILHDNGLRGPIPQELGYLPHLERLELHGNALAGPIPSVLAVLTRLEHLDLNSNGLTGSIPTELGRLSNLSYLRLSSNNLEGPIPPELGSLANLDTLHLSHNGLTGTIPPELGNLTQLRLLHITDTRLTGAIPSEFGNLARLIVLALNRNDLTGTIPPELGQLSRLRHLSATGSRLTGSIPPGLGNLRGVRNLWLSGNDLTGPIPSELAGLTELGSLLLGGNRLNGPIPPWLGSMVQLTHLALGHNELTGPIPPELGNLARLEHLNLAANSLTGSIPGELAKLRSLEVLDLQDNQHLHGELPLGFADLRALYFIRWDGTQVCAPAGRDFQQWLDDLSFWLGATCAVNVRRVLTAFYEATGGSSWKDNTNWLTEAPVSAWYGTVVDQQGRLTALDLRQNGLQGPSPVEMGQLVDLVRIDVRENQLSGRLHGGLGGLEGLRELYISHNRFNGALPGSLAELMALDDFQWNDSGLCAPESNWFQAWLASIDRHARGPRCSSPILLSVQAAHLNQAAQTLTGDVPLIAGRRALLRVFITADRASGHRPRARAMFFVDGREIHRADMPFEAPRGIPESIDPGQLDLSFHATIPADVLAPGVEMVVEVDPDGVVPRAAGSVVRVPDRGRAKLDVREMPGMNLTVVPILAKAESDSTVFEWTSALGPGHPALILASNILPVGVLEAKVRDEAFFTSVNPTSSREWTQLLQDFSLFALMEDGEGYYYGALARPPGSGINGIAYISRPASLGIPDAEVMAHELGHSMSLQHAPCGLVFDEDPAFPYRRGNIGTWGYDARHRRLVPPETSDLMSYCEPTWISHYHFKKSMEFRLGTEVAAAEGFHGTDRAKRLLLWGSVSPEGDMKLDPAFVLDAPATLPETGGRYSLEGFGADGSRHFSLQFSMDEIEHGGGGFLFTVPYREEWMESLENIVLSGPEGMAKLDRGSGAPMAIVVERNTGRLRAVLRDWDPVAVMRNETTVDDGTEVLVSYGLPGWAPQR